MRRLATYLTTFWIILELGGCQARNSFEGKLCPWQQQLAAAKAAIRRSDMSPEYLRVVHFGRPKGRGIVANTYIARGEYVTYYNGIRDIIEPDIDDNTYTFQIIHRSTRFWVDASDEDGSYGRLINDEWRIPNIRSRTIFVDGEPHVSFFALRSIIAGEEIHYDYGGSENFLPWRKQDVI
ncbi:N-lysine methyltransferase KMT5A-like [Haliotis rufescens]|uniref:N-lysine methyltransferase KMT5A-like n=1 Tax=Haliotis rufescens TaxID=6454 RepID=UPI00201FA669|nr:N-lysine methyltransferase KMT5A-like [Haliotis rufescens]